LSTKDKGNGNGNGNGKYTEKEIAWRRSKIIELRGYGLSQTEIARELQVSDASVSLDMQYLREQAKDSIKKYTTEHLPEQYQICLSALDTILKNAFVIMQKTDYNREKLQAMELFKDTHITKLELLSNATTIDSALEFIRSKQPRRQGQDQEQQGQEHEHEQKQTVF
jgi:hypothetical protein